MRKRFRKDRIASSENYKLSIKTHREFIISEHEKFTNLEISTRKVSYIRVFDKLIPVSELDVIEHSTLKNSKIIMEYITFISSNDWSDQKVNHGAFNGYVCVPKESKLYGVDYTELEGKIDIHGGLTYSGPFNNFLNSHTTILRGDYWVFGFDTFHFGDNEQNCNKEYVITETNKLLEQLKSLEL